MYVLISDWIPPRERNKLAVFIWSGVQFGTFLELPISGYLSSWLGWESVFYFNGACGLVWCLFYFIFCSNRPSESKSISTVSPKFVLKVTFSQIISHTTVIPQTNRTNHKNQTFDLTLFTLLRLWKERQIKIKSLVCMPLFCWFGERQSYDLLCEKKWPSK